MREDLLQRFLDYLSYDTMSSPCNASAGMRPSSDGQEKLLLHLKDCLDAMGIETYYGDEKERLDLQPVTGSESRRLRAFTRRIQGVHFRASC